MPIFSPHQRIGNYVVSFPLKDSTYAESYRVKDSHGNNLFLKLFLKRKMDNYRFDENGEILEVKISKILDHKNLAKYIDSGTISLSGDDFSYLVYSFVSGETLADKIRRVGFLNFREATSLTEGLLSGLDYIHNLPDPILHNEITAQNVMIDLSSSKNVPILIDFGSATFSRQSRFPPWQNLDLYYLAPEVFEGKYSVVSDLYSVGMLLYVQLFGDLPYDSKTMLVHNADKTDIVYDLIAAKSRPLKILGTNNYGVPEKLIQVIEKATYPNPGDRFQSASEFISALKEDSIAIMSSSGSHRKELHGFDAVAGMDELKEQLQSDVIDLLKNPEAAAELGIDIPNGLLFYGPPGCGKTYFAEKFAEEIGCNYMYIKCSDIASPYIHGGQSKIASIFKEAREKAPTILFFDEIEAMLTDRSKQNNVSESGEVNEFLTQMNQCGKDHVLVIGATNKPDIIDKAALRAGRLEYKYYIPTPDLRTREELFKLNLKTRNTESKIDYYSLAERTENYISADIKLIVDKAARKAFSEHRHQITMADLNNALENTHPSVSLDLIKEHERIKEAFEMNKSNKFDSTRSNKIGFVQHKNKDTENGK